MSDISSTVSRSAAKHPAMLVFMLVSLGEMLVGVAILAAPQQIVRFLLDAGVDAFGAIVARMLGVAVLALGITWWLAREEPSPCAPGFLVYNFGVGLLFGSAALVASNAVLPWIVCVAHLGAGIVFAALATRKA